MSKSVLSGGLSKETMKAMKEKVGSMGLKPKMGKAPKPKTKKEFVSGAELNIEVLPEADIEKVMDLLGWEVVEDGFFHFTDINGAKVLLKNCLKVVGDKREMNRPFRIGLAKRYMSEHLRKKWALNGQTVIFDWNNVCHNGQHCMVGYILAEQMRMLNKPVHPGSEIGWKDKCKMFWGHGGPITCPLIVVHGVDPAVADTLDLGLKRTMGDMFFRQDKFSVEALDSVGKGEAKPAKANGKKGKAQPVALPTPPMSEKTRRTLCNILSNAARLVWLRAGGRKISDAPHFPHSEAVDFVEAHPKLEEAVLYIWGLEGGTGKGGRKVSRFIGSLGVAAGIYYLMASSSTDPDEYAEIGPGALNFDNEKKAREFWARMAEGTNLNSTDPIYVLREHLPSVDGGSALGREEKICMIVKAFNIWAEKKKAELKDVTVRKDKNDNGKLILAEAPKLGGLDIEEPEKIEDDFTKIVDNREGHMKGKLWAEGDSAWVYSEDGDHWYGTVDEVFDTDDGKEALLTDADTGKQWQEPLKKLWLKYPGVQ